MIFLVLPVLVVLIVAVSFVAVKCKSHTVDGCELQRMNEAGSPSYSSLFESGEGR